MIKKFEGIKFVADFIEQNLHNELTAEELSAACYISHAQLYRDFYNATGHTVKEYIRKRRLSNALALIKNSNFGLADIAADCGYSSQQAMCRAIKTTLGKTTTQYKNNEEYFFFPPFSSNIHNQINVARETLPETLCLVFRQSSFRNIENNALARFFEFAPDFSGRIFGRNGEQNKDGFCYELYITDYIGIAEKVNSVFQLKGFNPPASALFASSIVSNMDSEINNAWDYLYSQWISFSMFEYTGEAYYEEYIYKDGKIKKLRLLLPIAKRKSHISIRLQNLPPMRFLVSTARGCNAEHYASKAVIEYVSELRPSLLKTSKKFYAQKGVNTYISGILLEPCTKTLPVSHPVANLVYGSNFYAVLHSDAFADYDYMREFLINWMRENALTADESEIFAVLDASDSYEKPKITLYCPLKR